MPSRNSVKTYVPESYYHVYDRGVAKQPIFLDATDKRQFLKILERHLDPANAETKSDGVPYRKFNQELDLLCYCLMGNHFHLLFYLGSDSGSLSALMRSVLTAYTMYFNARYKRVGTLFQGVFKASLITDESYLAHITRYIHLNPRTYRTYHYSSLVYYLGKTPPVWLKPHRILAMFAGDDYGVFVADYEANHLALDTIKRDLANL